MRFLLYTAIQGDLIMKKLSITAAVLVSVGLGAIPQAVHAHGAWLAKVHGDYNVMWGHDPSNSDPYNPAEVIAAQQVKNGQIKPLHVIRDHKFARMQADKPGIVAAIMDSGFVTKTADGKYRRLNKSDAAKLAKVEASAYRTRYTVLYANNREKPKKMGYDLELLPSRNPGQFKKGEFVPVQVLFKGKPLANASIQSNYLSHPKQEIKTDAQGKAMVPVANYRFNAWAVSHRIPYTDLQKADEFRWSTIVTFVAPRKPRVKH